MKKPNKRRKAAQVRKSKRGAKRGKRIVTPSTGRVRYRKGR